MPGFWPARLAGRLEQLVVVDQQLAHRVQVGEEGAHEPRDLRVVALSRAHLGVLLVAVLGEEVVQLVRQQRQPRQLQPNLRDAASCRTQHRVERQPLRELQPEGPVFVPLWERLVEAVRRR